jgi:hypothetical protein
MQHACSIGCAHRWSLGESMNSLPVPAPAVIPRGLREARTSRGAVGTESSQLASAEYDASVLLLAGTNIARELRSNPGRARGTSEIQRLARHPARYHTRPMTRTTCRPREGGRREVSRRSRARYSDASPGTASVSHSSRRHRARLEHRERPSLRWRADTLIYHRGCAILLRRNTQWACANRTSRRPAEADRATCGRTSSGRRAMLDGRRRPRIGARR